MKLLYRFKVGYSLAKNLCINYSSESVQKAMSLQPLKRLTLWYSYTPFRINRRNTDTKY